MVGGARAILLITVSGCHCLILPKLFEEDFSYLKKTSFGFTVCFGHAILLFFLNKSLFAAKYNSHWDFNWCLNREEVGNTNLVVRRCCNFLKQTRINKYLAPKTNVIATTIRKLL